MNPLMRPVRGQGARRLWAFGVVAVLAAALGGCASAVTELPDSPAQGERNVSAYPAVHDVPPARAERTLTDDEQAKLQQELTEAGQSMPAKVEEIERADARPDPATTPPAKTQPVKTQPAKPFQAAPANAKKQPARQAAGTRPNP